MCIGKVGLAIKDVVFISLLNHFSVLFSMTRFTPDGLIVLEERIALGFLNNLTARHTRDPRNEPLHTIRSVLFPFIERENLFYYKMLSSCFTIYSGYFPEEIIGGFVDSVTLFYHLLRAQYKNEGMDMLVLAEENGIPDRYPIDAVAILEKQIQVLAKMCSENPVIHKCLEDGLLDHVHSVSLREQAKGFIVYSYWMFSEVAKETMAARLNGESPN